MFTGRVKTDTFNHVRIINVHGEISGSNALQALKNAQNCYHSPVELDKWRIFREVKIQGKR